MPKEKLQWVWPKDSTNVRRRSNGFFGRLTDIMTNKGPDIFITRRGDQVKADEWSNWDSYHDHDCDKQEAVAGQFRPLTTSRSSRRYDPFSRRYVKWSKDQDWDGRDASRRLYPRFTENEYNHMLGLRQRNQPLNPHTMRRWDWYGPLRFSPEDDDFWRKAHRSAGNRRQGSQLNAPSFNPNFYMHVTDSGDLEQWMLDAGIPEPV